MRFHSYHGKNIELLKDGTVAHRRFSFANSIAFSERPLKPYELFLLEINSNEFGWSGHLRFGLTVLDPGQRPVLPFYALPDLNASGLAWIFAITCSVGRPANQIEGHYHVNVNHNLQRLVGQNGAVFLDGDDLMPPQPPLLQILVESESASANDVIRTAAAAPVNRDLGAAGPLDGRVRLSTDVGSRIGVYYEVSAENGGTTAEMHFVINGVDQGPAAVNIPFNGRPLFAIVDVYGTTKQVEIVQPAQTVNSLQHSCRICILKYVPYEFIDHLPLPEKMKAFLHRSRDNKFNYMNNYDD